MHTHKEMMQFSLGDKICFEAPGRGKQFGTLVKYNKKTVRACPKTPSPWKIDWEGSVIKKA
jgi:hypothetical protein